MKILVVTQYFWPEVFRINDLVQGLSERNHEVEVMTGLPNYPKGRFFKGYSIFSVGMEKINNVKVWRAPLYPRRGGGKISLFLNYISFAIFSSLLIPFFCRNKYDIIFTFAPSPITVALPAIILSKIKKIPLCLWVQDLWPESIGSVGVHLPPIMFKQIRKIVDFIYRNTDKILIQSPGFFEHVKQASVENSKIEYLPNWAEAIYSPILPDSSFAQKMGIPQGFIVMFAGNIGAAQDFDTIINAAKKLKIYSDIKFLIIGNGRFMPKVKEEIARFNLESTFILLGQYPLELMPSFFAHADVLLATLKDDPVLQKTIPSKLQSYLACGKPIIASLGDVVAEIIKESKAGIAVSPSNEHELADAILTLYHMNKTDIKELGENGHDFYQRNFGRGRLIDKLEKILESSKKDNSKLVNQHIVLD